MCFAATVNARFLLFSVRCFAASVIATFDNAGFVNAGFLMHCRHNAMPPWQCHAAYPLPLTCHQPTCLYHVLSIPLILVSIIQIYYYCILVPSAHPSVLYHSLSLILVLSATKCSSAHPSTLCNQYTINPSPYIIHTPAHPSALGTAPTSAHPSAMATIYPLGPHGMAPSGTGNCPLGWPV